MTKTISCSVGYHRGGLGQHFSQVVEEARAAGELRRYYSPHVKDGDAVGVVVRSKLAPLVMRCTPARFSPGWRWHLDCDLFDRKVARQLAEPLECFIGFAGQALHSFSKAKKLGCRRFELVAGNSHVKNCVRKHAEATRRHPIEKPWLNGAHVKKTLAEYEMADMIWVASEYSRLVFMNQGVSAQKVGRIHYSTDSRYVPDAIGRPGDGVFRVLYCGAVSVAKGVPLLVEAFAKLDVGPAELTLVGGTSTRGMKRYMDEAMARDGRIKLAPGDPLPHLRKADVCVHPSWEDNLAYAPLEALRCGVKVIVTEDTGMKEYVVEGENGSVVPTGDVEAILERLTRIARAR